MRRANRSARKGGFTMIEVLIALTLLAVMAAGLSSAGLYAADQLRAARSDLRAWALLERIADSLTAQRVPNITAGSEMVDGRTIQWAVIDATPPARLDLIVTGPAIRTDTITLFLPIR